MPTVLFNGMTVHYRTWGSGNKHVVILHGWPADSSHYEALGPLLAQAGFNVVVPDFPGWGGTDKPPRAFTVNDYAAWVHGLLATLSIEKCILFGHSFGGRVAIKYVTQHTSQITLLILCAAAGIKPRADTMKRRVLAVAARMGNIFFSMPGIRAVAPVARKFLYRVVGSRDYLEATGVMKETIIKVLEEDSTAHLRRIHRPTLLVWGSEDGATPVADGSKMHELIAGSRLVIFEHERHNLPKTVPEKVAQEIIKFVESHAA